MELGEIKTGYEIGRGDSSREKWTKYVWCQCPCCKKDRWIVQYLFKKNGATLCQVCSGRKNGKVNAKLWGKGL